MLRKMEVLGSRFLHLALMGDEHTLCGDGQPSCPVQYNERGAPLCATCADEARKPAIMLVEVLAARKATDATNDDGAGPGEHRFAEACWGGIATAALPGSVLQRRAAAWARRHAFEAVQWELYLEQLATDVLRFVQFVTNNPRGRSEKAN